MAIQIQLRRDSASDWTTENPILADGEMGIESDTRRIKFGNGTDDWDTLPYFSGGGGISERSFVIEPSSVTITPTNVETYRNNVILFTNTTGTVNLNLGDDLFTVDDEILVKHFSSTPVGDINISTDATGLIDNAVSLEVGNDEAFLIKYQGSNNWKILSDKRELYDPFADVLTFDANVVLSTLGWQNLKGKTIVVEPANDTNLNVTFLADIASSGDWIYIKQWDGGNSGSTVTITAQGTDPSIDGQASLVLNANDSYRIQNLTGNEWEIVASHMISAIGTDSNAIHDNISGEIDTISEKSTPVDADIIIIEDSADSFNKKKVQISNLPTGVSEDNYVDAFSGLPTGAGYQLNIGRTGSLSGLSLAIPNASGSNSGVISLEAIRDVSAGIITARNRYKQLRDRDCKG